MFFSCLYRIVLIALFMLPFGVVRAAGEIQFDQGLEYSRPEGVSLQLNMARPKNAKGPLPCVLCIHGGGFRAGKREGYDSLIRTLAGEGYAAVTISYRLAP